MPSFNLSEYESLPKPSARTQRFLRAQYEGLFANSQSLLKNFRNGADVYDQLIRTLERTFDALSRRSFSGGADDAKR